MSLQDRLASQDASQMLLAGSSIAFVAATSASGTRYNFPLMLFGIIAHEMHSSTLPMRQFLTLTLVSAIFDFIHFLSFRFSVLMGIVNILVFLLKAPIFFTCLSQLRERGGDLRFGPPSLQGLSGSQNWSMPGNFGGGPAQTSQPSNPPPPPPGSFPSSGGFRLGGDEDDTPEGQSDNQQGGGGGGGGGPPPGPAPGRNGYQSIA